MFRSISSIFKRKKYRIAPDLEPTNIAIIQEPEEEPEPEQEKEPEEEPAEQFLDTELIEVIPQIDGTCWFNSILMALLYSQGIRRVIIQEIAKWTPEEIRDDKFKGFVVYVLKYNYKDPEKIRELFKRRFKTSSLLLSLLKKTPSLFKIKENIQLQLTKNTRNLSYSTIDFLLHNNFLNIFFKNTDDYLSIYYSRYNYLYYINNNNIHTKPKIIFLYHHENLREDIINMIEGEYELSNVYDRVSYLMYFYVNYITINGVKYRLDACINNNYNKTKNTIGHAITGITYDYKPYVYNGWANPQKSNTKIRPYIKRGKYACPLFAHDWKTNLIKRNEGFCISREKCDLTEEDTSDLCFNFNKKGGAILVYVRMDEQKTSLASLQSGIRASELQFTSRSLSSIEREFYKIDEKNLDELREQLIHINYINREDLEQFELALRANKYNIFYFMIFHKRLEDELKKSISIEEILIELYREFLKVYIKTNSKIYLLSLLTDDLIFNYLAIERIKKILGIIGYSEEEIEEIYENYTNYLILWYLLNTENKINKNHLLFLIMSLYIMYNKKLKLEELSDKQILERFNPESRWSYTRSYEKIVNSNSLLKAIIDKNGITSNIRYNARLLFFVEKLKKDNNIYKTTENLFSQ